MSSYEQPSKHGHSPNAVSMLAHRLRRWLNIETALGECPVAGHVLINGSYYHAQLTFKMVACLLFQVSSSIHYTNHTSMSEKYSSDWSRNENYKRFKLYATLPTRHQSNAALMLYHRLRSWHSIKTNIYLIGVDGHVICISHWLNKDSESLQS